MVSPSRTSQMAQPASASLSPQDILVAVNSDPMAVLHYIISLENEVNRLQHQLVASREEMYTVIQISMSAVASEMSKTLNVTKNSLIGIQEKFHRIAASRSDIVGAVRPGVLKQYQGGALGNQVSGDGKLSTSNILGIGKEDRKEDRKLDLLTSECSLQYGRRDGMSFPLNPTPKIAAHYTPTKNALGPGTLLDLSRAQENAVFPSTAANITPQFATTSSIFELSPTRSNIPFPRSLAVKPPMNANVKIAAPALTVRSDSQKNVQKPDPATEAFIAFMANSHKNPRNYRSTPQPNPVKVSSIVSPITTHADPADDTAPVVSEPTRPFGPHIKYDVAFLKKLQQPCKNQPNPFASNRDEELKPVLKWGPGANKVPPKHRQPGLRISSTSGPPGGPPNIPVAPSTWF